MKKTLSFIVLLLFITMNISGKIITVTSSVDTGIGSLREAVENASNGDVIVFDESITTVYFAGIIKIDKNITVNGDETNNTVFQNAVEWTDTENRKHYFEVLENAQVILNNLTLQDNQSNRSGGAIYNIGTLTLNNCNFSNNRTTGSGGAVYNGSGGDLTVNNCVFMHNYAANAGGGAICDAEGNISISNSRFTGNESTNNGGAVKINNNCSLSSSVISSISSCIFEENTSPFGGAVNNMGIADINNCTFTKNKASSSGGAVDNGRQMNMNNCIFTQNEADEDGIFSNNSATHSNWIEEAKATLVNCLFANNTIMCDNQYPNYHAIISNVNFTKEEGRGYLTLINCTIADNTGVGINYRRTTTELYNTVIWNNVARINSKYDVYKDTVNSNISGVLFAYNCLIGTSNIDLTGNNNIIGIEKDPFFAEDYSLLENSPAIDAGNNLYLTNEITTDLAGNLRISNNTVDLGAYEYQGETASDESISADTDKIPVAYFNTMGVKLPGKPETGIYIVLYDNGIAEKKLN